MELKIFHTGDLHIGMKFSNYPDDIREELVEARLNVLDRMIKKANDERCNLFIVAGDLFDKVNIAQKNIDRVIGILNEFSGDCVIVMPGNHDYDDGLVELWRKFKQKSIDSKILLVNENRAYSLKNYDVDAVIYPAYCSSKHSDTNNLGWIKECGKSGEGLWHIGIAHGSITGLSPDMKNNYFNMARDELKSILVDLWLLGHMHVCFPCEDKISNQRVFNAGTPEPDGFDCKHGGSAWIISIDDNKNISAEKITTGEYRFFDDAYKISDEEGFNSIKNIYLSDKPDRKLVRLKLSGRIERDLYGRRHSFYGEIKDRLGYCEIDDTEVGIKITKDDIDKEFTVGSLPYTVLTELSLDISDNEALQMVYELIQEVK